MRVSAVWHDEYFGTVQISHRELPNDLTPLQIWQQLTDIKDRDPQEMGEGYIEDWDAYGSHHKGMITRIWIEGDAVASAQRLYDELISNGVKPSED